MDDRDQWGKTTEEDEWDESAVSSTRVEPSDEQSMRVEPDGKEEVPSPAEVNSALSAIASLIIPGLGQLLQGQTQRGLVVLGGAIGLAVFGVGMLLFITVITFGLGLVFFLFVPFVWPIIHIAAAIDAYLQAEKINSGEITPESKPSI